MSGIFGAVRYQPIWRMKSTLIDKYVADNWTF